MGAPLGFKTFATGDVLTAADTNGYLMQGIWVFANATARDAAVTSPQEGNACYLKDTDNIMVYSGSAWVTKSAGTASFVGCGLYMNGTSLSYTSGVALVLPFTTEDFDTNSFHDNVTNNSRITIPTGYAGKYLVSTTWRGNDACANYAITKIYKNGTGIAIGTDAGEVVRHSNLGSNTATISASIVLDLAVADYLQMYSQNDMSTAAHLTYARFSAVYLGA